MTHEKTNAELVEELCRMVEDAADELALTTAIRKKGWEMKIMENTGGYAIRIRPSPDGLICSFDGPIGGGRGSVAVKKW